MAEAREVHILLFEPSWRGDRAAYAAEFTRPRGRPPKLPQSVPAGAASGSSGAAPVSPPASVSEAVQKIWKKLDHLKSPDRQEMVRRLHAGLPFADPGERDSKMQMLCSIIAEMDDAVDPEEAIEAVFAPSLRAIAAEPNARLTYEEELGKAIEKLSRAQRDLRPVHAQTQASLEDITLSVKRAAEARLAGKPVGEAVEGAVLAPGESPAFTQDQIDAQGKQINGSPPEKFIHERIIQNGDSFYVFSGGYKAPVRKIALMTALRKDFLPYPDCPLKVMKADGSGMRSMTFDEVTENYGSIARFETADLTLQTSYYDSITETFHRAVCPKRALTPLFDPQIDRWISLLDPSNLLKQWLAGVVQLARPCCALYLHGPKGSGKSMLAAGIARIYSDGAPTEMSKILDNFNADLLSNPIVVADEQLPKRHRGDRTSADLRFLIGNLSRKVSEKYRPNVDLKGAVRVILLANNDKLLSFDEELSGDDLAAVAERIYYLHVGDLAAQYLISIGNSKGTRDWVDKDLIARHVLWLAENVAIEDNGRFLVTGSVTQMHRTLAVQDKVTSQVLEWLCGHFAAPKIALAINNLVLVGDGKVYVNGQVFQQFWNTYITSDKQPPTIQKLGRSLSNLSLPGESSVRIHSLRYHSIDPGFILDFAERNHIGDPDEMKKLIDAPRKTGGVSMAAESSTSGGFPGFEKIAGADPTDEDD